MLGDSTNTPRPVKRMRLKDASDGGRGGKENRTAQYFATLQDKVQGTPKSEWGVSRDQLKDAEADHLFLHRKTGEPKELDNGPPGRRSEGSGRRELRNS